MTGWGMLQRASISEPTKAWSNVNNSCSTIQRGIERSEASSEMAAYTSGAFTSMRILPKS